MTVTKCFRIPEQDSGGVAKDSTGTARNLTGSTKWTPLIAIAIFLLSTTGAHCSVLVTGSPSGATSDRRGEKNIDATAEIDTKLDTSTTESYDFISKSAKNVENKSVDVKSVNLKLGERKFYKDTFDDVMKDRRTTRPAEEVNTFSVIASSDVKILQMEDGKAVVVVPDNNDDEMDKYLSTFMANDTRNFEGAKAREELPQSDMPFRRLPPIEINSNEVMSELNVKQVLECKLPPNATFSHWTKNGEKMNMIVDGPGVRSRLLLTKAGHAVISKVIKEDDGTWVCHGADKTNYRFSSEEISLIVLEVPYNTTLEAAGVKVIGDAMKIITVKEGMNLSIICTLKGGRPKPSFYWNFRGLHEDEDPDFYPNQDYTETINKTDMYIISTITFLTSKIFHNSTITCVTTHLSLAKPMQTSMRILIESVPRFIITRFPGFGYPIIEGMFVFLRCQVESYPPSVLRWQKDKDDIGTDVSESQEDGVFVNYTSIRREDSGWYKCIAIQSGTLYASIGYYLNIRYDDYEATREPEDEEKPVSGRIEAELGGIVQLHCPGGSIGCWGRKSDDGMWIGAGSTAPHGALSISGLLYQEAGEYRCEGISPAVQGKLQVLREAQIVVTGGPTVFPSNKTILVSEGQNASFSAEYCANPAPTRVVWIASERLIRLGEHIGQIMAHNATNGSTPGCSIAQLTIEPAGLQHNGEFSLLVRNSQGSKEAVFQLAVTATRKVSKTESIFNDWLGISNAVTLKMPFVLIIFTSFFASVVKTNYIFFTLH